MLNRLGRFATVGAYIFFVISITVAFGLHGRALREVCVQSNKDRTAIAAFVGNASSRVTLTANAVLASKTASPQEKKAAAQNLAGVKVFQQGLLESLPQQDCPSGWLP